MTLGEFLKQQVGNAEPWNCSTMPADWCMALGWPDFAARWRHVVGLADCGAAHVEPGELLSLWNDGIGASLPVVDDEPDAGDIGVIEALGFEVGGIFTGGKWALRGQRGLHFLAPGQVRVIQVWRP